jgi:hypothetical protein
MYAEKSERMRAAAMTNGWSSFRRVEDLRESCGQIIWKLGNPRWIEKSDRHEVPKMDTILISKCGEFHPYKSFEGNQAKLACILTLLDLCIWDWLLLPGFLGSEHNMQCVAHTSLRTFEKDLHGPRLTERCNTPVHKARNLKSRPRSRQIFTPQQDVHISSVSHRRLVHTRHPSCNGIPSNDSVSYSGCAQRSGSAKKAASDIFDRVTHALPGDRA